MAKRFADTDSYCKEWFRKLPIIYKVAWDYCCRTCSAAGILSLDRELADFQIGEAVDWPAFFQLCGDRVIELPGGKFYLTTFIEFQYGELSEDCNPHKPVIKELKKFGLWEGYLKGIYTLKDKEQEKEKDKDQEGKGGAGGKPKFRKPTAAELTAYAVEKSLTLDVERFMDFYESKGWKVGHQPMKDWQAAVRNWCRSDARGSPNGKPSNAPKTAAELGFKPKVTT